MSGCLQYGNETKLGILEKKNITTKLFEFQYYPYLEMPILALGDTTF